MLFRSVPGFHRRLEEWLHTLPPDVDARDMAKRTLESEAVSGKAGDFVIWHQALPHCATPNRGEKPRLVQYLTYLPEVDGETRSWR